MSLVTVIEVVSKYHDKAYPTKDDFESEAWSMHQTFVIFDALSKSGLKRINTLIDEYDMASLRRIDGALNSFIFSQKGAPTLDQRQLVLEGKVQLWAPIPIPPKVTRFIFEAVPTAYSFGDGLHPDYPLYRMDKEIGKAASEFIRSSEYYDLVPGFIVSWIVTPGRKRRKKSDLRWITENLEIVFSHSDVIKSRGAINASFGRTLALVPTALGSGVL